MTSPQIQDSLKIALIYTGILLLLLFGIFLPRHDFITQTTHSAQELTRQAQELKNLPPAHTILWRNSGEFVSFLTETARPLTDAILTTPEIKSSAISVDVTAQMTHSQLANFIQTLESHRPLLWIDNLEIRPMPEISPDTLSFKASIAASLRPEPAP